MATVTPGYTFSSNEVVTPTKLNQAATPTVSVANDEITTAKILNAAVTTAKIADSNVTTAKIADSNVTTAKIADSAITSAKILDANVTTAKILDANVTGAKLANNAVETAKLADGSVTTAKLVDSSVTTAKLANAQQVASAWCSVDGDIPDIATSGTTFTKVSDTVVRVTRSAHGLLNGDCVCFDALASPNNYLNGTWIVSGVTQNTFDFTISGAIVPASPAAQIIRPTRIKRKYNVSKVGRLSLGNYRIFFENSFLSDAYIVVGSALYTGDPRMGVGPVSQTTSYVDVRTSYYNGTEYNVDPLNVIVFGGN